MSNLKLWNYKKKTGQKFLTLVWTMSFQYDPKSTSNKSKRDKWNCIKQNTLLHNKENKQKREIYRIKESIFQIIHMTRKLISKIYKELIQLSSEKKTQLRNRQRGFPWWSSGWESACWCGGMSLIPALGGSHMPWSYWAYVSQLLRLRFRAH